MPLSPVNSSGQRFTSEQFFRLYIPHRGELEFFCLSKMTASLPKYVTCECPINDVYTWYITKNISYLDLPSMISIDELSSCQHWFIAQRNAFTELGPGWQWEKKKLVEWRFCTVLFTMPLSPVNFSGQRFTSEQFSRLYIPHRGELEFLLQSKIEFGWEIQVKAILSHFTKN